MSSTGLVTAKGGTVTARGGSSPQFAPPPTVDTTYVFNDAEDYPLGPNAAGTGKTAGGSSRFDYFNLGGNGVNEISAAHPFAGTRSFRHTSGSTAASSYNAWLTNVSHTTPEYASVQVYIGALTGSTVLLGIRDTANASKCAAQFTLAGKIQLTANGGTVVATTDASYPVGAAFRVELAVIVSSATVGRAVLRYFADPFGTIPTEILDVSNINTTAAAPGRIHFGLYQQLANQSVWLKNMRKSNVGWPPAPAGIPATVTTVGYGTGAAGANFDTTLWTAKTTGAYAGTTYKLDGSAPSSLHVVTSASTAAYSGTASIVSAKTQQSGKVSGTVTRQNKLENRLYIGAFLGADPGNGNDRDGWYLNVLAVSNTVVFQRCSGGVYTDIATAQTITFPTGAGVMHWEIQPGVGATVWLDGAARPSSPNFPTAPADFPASASGIVQYRVNTGAGGTAFDFVFSPVAFDALDGPHNDPLPDGAISPDLTKPYAPTAVSTLAWTLDFEDVFAGTALDSTKWVDHEPFYSSPGTSNAGGYQPIPATPNQLTVADGVLTLKVRAASGLPGSAAATVADISTRGKYATPQLSTGKATFIEARIKSPSGRGLWPAFWTEGDGDLHVGSDNHTGWPTKGENDIFEFFNNNSGTGDCYWSLHFPADVYSSPPGTWLNDTHVYQSSHSPELLDSWHTWGLHLTPTQMTVYIDGVLWKTYTAGQTYPGNSLALPPMLFTNPQFLRLDMTVGGAAGSGWATSDYQDGDMLVDYVRTWALGGPGGSTVTFTDNGDGTVTASGSGVTEHGDGTVTIVSNAITDNSDGTITVIDAASLQGFGSAPFGVSTFGTD